MRKTLFTTLLLFAFLPSLFAQQRLTFSVVGFTEKPFDTAAGDARYRQRDGNGELFAIVKIVSREAGDNLNAYSFDFNFCEHRQGPSVFDGERWLYVQRNAMRVTITREGYAAVKHELEYTVQPGKVYELVLSPAPRVVKKRHLLFQVTPADSKALILFKAEGDADYRTFKDGQVNDEGMLSDKLVLGRYFYKITSQNYHPSEGIIELADEEGTYTESVTLRPNFGTLTLTATDGCEIFVDGESKGFGSWTGNFYPGFYNVECRKPNHKSTVETIEVKEGETASVALKAPQPITGTLDIESDPLQATVTIDGRERGKTPVEIKDLIIGSHVLEVSKKGYKSKRVTVDIKENEATEQSVTLEKEAVKKPVAEPVKKKKTAKKTAAEPVKKKEKIKVKRYNLSGYYVELAGNVGHLMDIGLNAGAYFSYFNIEAYGNYGLQRGEFYSTDRIYRVSPVSFGGRIGVGIPAGMSFRFTPQFGAGGLMVAGDETRAYATTLSLGVRCEWECLGHFGISVTPEYVWGIKSDTMQRLTSVCPIAERWCSGFGARIGIFFYF